MKILEFKRSGIGLIAEFRRIPNGFPNQGIDSMCLTMINPATSWFEIVELPTVAQETTVTPLGKGKKVTFSKYTKVA
jgi:hypothetical protein